MSASRRWLDAELEHRGISRREFMGYRLPPEANLMAVAHYLEALDWQREFIKLHAVLGGKKPHRRHAHRRHAERRTAAAHLLTGWPRSL